MRRLLLVAAVVVFSAPALAQQRPPAQNRAPAPPPAQAQQQAPAEPAGMFPCRTQAEVCHVIAVGSANQGTLLYSNAPAAEGKEGGAVNVQGADLAQHVGKVVMLSGEFGAAGIANAHVIDVAGPLLSFAIKLQMSGGGGDDEEDDTPQQQQTQPQRGNAPAPAPQRNAPAAPAQRR
ncbi:MAG: hypothetical protein AB7O60_12675 [Variibacter sp.]